MKKLPLLPHHQEALRPSFALGPASLFNYSHDCIVRLSLPHQELKSTPNCCRPESPSPLLPPCRGNGFRSKLPSSDSSLLNQSLTWMGLPGRIAHGSDCKETGKGLSGFHLGLEIPLMRLEIPQTEQKVLRGQKTWTVHYKVYVGHSSRAIH